MIRDSASFRHRNPAVIIFRSMSRSDSVHQVISAIGSPRVPASRTPASASFNPNAG